MKRGELYRVYKPHKHEPKKSRVFLIVSRQTLLNSNFSTIICAPVYTAYHGLSTQVQVGIDEGLKHDSSIHCDELISLPKAVLTDYIGKLPIEKMQMLDRALLIALDL
jgi:mRNA interferase MazF